MQLELLWRDEATLHRELEQASGLALALTLTDNTSTMMSMKRSPQNDRAHLRLHRMFLAANSSVVMALGAWMRRRKCSRSAAILNGFIQAHRHHIQQRKRAPDSNDKSGVYFDIEAMYASLNKDYFQRKVTADIVWGRMPGKSRRYSIRFGSYSQEEHLIRIHPLLDQPHVPEFFVRYIVFHEMLHAFLGVAESPTGRRRIHTPEFKAIEREYEDYARAIAWLEDPDNLRTLLRSGKIVHQPTPARR